MKGKIKQVHINLDGLPEELINSIYWVGRKYRKNHLSHQPGGSDVIVEYHEGAVLGYDWIKFPSKYIRMIFTEGVKEEIENYEELSQARQLNIIKAKIRRIFARKYENEDDSKSALFEEIWNSLTSKELPWRVLKNYDLKKNESNKAKYYKLKITEIEIITGEKYATVLIEKLETGKKRIFKCYVKNKYNVGDEVMMHENEAEKMAFVKKQKDGKSYWEAYEKSLTVGTT